MSDLGVKIIKEHSNYILETLKNDTFTNSELHYLKRLFEEFVALIVKTLKRGPNV